MKKDKYDSIFTKNPGESFTENVGDIFALSLGQLGGFYTSNFLLAGAIPGPDENARPKLRPIITMVVGTTGSTMLQPPFLRNVFKGMASAALTDLVMDMATPELRTKFGFAGLGSDGGTMYGPDNSDATAYLPMSKAGGFYGNDDEDLDGDDDLDGYDDDDNFGNVSDNRRDALLALINK